ncbi:MAG: response regulator [bacterium]|nr:response regulator [bacterium]
MSKILVVEDDPNVLLSIVVRLKADGHEVVTAQDGGAAISTAVDERPDLMILDISMPAGNGFQVAETIQDDARTAGTPVIFMTASRRPEFRQKAEELKASGFFEKPYDAAQLLSTVRSTLGTA